jgi:hypothetical protein
MYYVLFLIADSNIPKIKDHIKKRTKPKNSKNSPKNTKLASRFFPKKHKTTPKNTKFTTPNITKGP